MDAPITRLPLEILENIALALLDGPAPSLTPLLPLLLVSSHFNSHLAFRRNKSLYARIFRASFDTSAPERRLGDVPNVGLAARLRVNHRALRCLRSGDLHSEDLLAAFRTSFAMLIENDGRNRTHLDRAGLPGFVDAFIRERLYENARDGWPDENEINSLALWLLWLTTSEARLSTQTPAQRAQMTRLILPFVLMPIRYPAFLAPHIHFSYPLSRDPERVLQSLVTAHGPYPNYRSASRLTSLYHLGEFVIRIPLATIAAKLIYFAHREVAPITVPPHLPQTRAHALQGGITGIMPTQEDVHELNEHKVAQFVPTTTWDWQSQIPDHHTLSSTALSKFAPSARWDDDWNRLADCNSLFHPVSLKRTHYTPGLLTGLWQGRMLSADDRLYADIIQNPQMPSAFAEQTVGLTVAPFFMRLQEYHCMDVHPNGSAPSGGIQNAWFHGSVRLDEVAHGLTITCQDRTSFYNEYVAGGPGLHVESNCRGCQHRGTSEMVFREDDYHFLAMVDQTLTSEGPRPGADIDDDDNDNDDDDMMDDDASDAEANMEIVPELVVKRRCDGILDIVLVGETDLRHGQAWHHYRFYGRVREWDGLVALIRVPVHPTPASFGPRIITGYVVGGQNFVGNWQTSAHSSEVMPFESAFAMSKRE